MKSKYLPVLLIALPLLFASLQVQSQDVSATGTFSGDNKHVTTGQVSLVKTDEGMSIVLGADFSLDNAPYPSVGLGKDGEFLLDIAKLKSLSGEQTYLLPASVNISDFNEIYIWCEKFSVSLGSAKL
ncbi:DM13 domain-containing protein [Granulosicoccus antarcticus]|uniref:DM13 domain-containing protein n=1 Tax=Granulosicoccus antarcticus IMCC3135 TaxID=1192854 RepID=A0A2Z2NKY9_9GAMM|nr:DM13 domain-containing protein [Granulosicoccus antarcticus]ASJ71986.1 hypothetical protein IMCC3135_09445 [Granulosicoccus antarcticus IMCC3135]